MKLRVSAKFMSTPMEAASTQRSLMIANYLEARNNLQNVVATLTEKSITNETITKSSIQAV